MSFIVCGNTREKIKVDPCILEVLGKISWWQHHSGYAITKINNKHVEDAAKAYNTAATERYGGFAALNYITAST